jgi:cytidylate kinase
MYKRWLRILAMIIITCISTVAATAQCSICTKTAQQLGEGPAKSLNTGILYLMFAPLAIMGFIGFRWWKKEKEVMASENKTSA